MFSVSISWIAHLRCGGVLNKILHWKVASGGRRGGSKVDDKSKLVKKRGYYKVVGSQLLMAQLVELVNWILGCWVLW